MSTWNSVQIIASRFCSEEIYWKSIEVPLIRAGLFVFYVRLEHSFSSILSSITSLMFWTSYHMIPDKMGCIQRKVRSRVEYRHFQRLMQWPFTYSKLTNDTPNGRCGSVKQHVLPTYFNSFLWSISGTDAYFNSRFYYSKCSVFIANLAFESPYQVSGVHS